MKIFFLFLIILISLPTFAEDFKCPADTMLIDFTPSSTQERMKVCQKKINGNFVKHGAEIIYNKDGSVKSKKYFNLNIETSFPSEESSKELKIKSIKSGYGSSCVLISGAVKCWGAFLNGGGLPENDFTPMLIPTQVKELEHDVKAISVGRTHSCALMNDGFVKCWGINNSGELGDGTLITKKLPSRVIGLNSRVDDISAGENYTCALVSESAKCWGQNFFGALGTGVLRGGNMSVPTPVIGLSSGVQSISALTHTCSLLNGGIQCWGNNYYGNLGDGTNTASAIPVKVLGLSSGVQNISLNRTYSCVLMISGEVKCWGRNSSGELGDGTAIDRATPTQVHGLSSGVQAISTGVHHACALIKGGVMCWGYNNAGAIGDGTTVSRLIPTQVIGLTSNVLAISTGSDYSCALIDNGVVKCWGINNYGQLGNGTTVNKLTPTQVVGL